MYYITNSLQVPFYVDQLKTQLVFEAVALDYLTSSLMYFVFE